MTRFPLSLMFVLCLVFISAQDVSEADFNLVSKSLNAMNPSFSKGTARNAGMAGSMGALGGDMTAISTNPAGSGVFIETALNLTMDYGNVNDRVVLGTSRNSDNNHFEINQVGAVIKFPTYNDDWKLVNLGILYDHQNLSESVNFGRNDNLSAFDEDADGNQVDEYKFYGYNREMDGKKEKFTINFATNYKNKLFLGMNLNIHSYTMEYGDQYLGHLESLNETYSFDAWSYPYDEQASGISIGVGAIFKPVQTVRLGAAFQSPIGWSDISTNFTQYYYNESSGIVEDYVEEGLWEEDDATSAGFFNLSTGFVIKKSFALNIDYLHYLNSSNKYKPSSEYTGTNNFLKNYVKNTNEFRIGGEYNINAFSLRAGYGYISSPMKKVSLTDGYRNGNNQFENAPIKNFLAGEKKTLGLGFGYSFDNLTFDFAYQHQNQSYYTLMSGTHVDPGYYPLEVPNFLGKVDQKINNFIFTIGYVFGND